MPAFGAASLSMTATARRLRVRMFTEEKMEVDSWPAARAYLGEVRISGAYPGTNPCAPPRADDYIVWPVVSARDQVSVWCDLMAISKSTGLEVAEVHRRWTLQHQAQA